MNNYFYPRSPCGERRKLQSVFPLADGISIHALLAESDRLLGDAHMPTQDFYPRSPCGERQAEQPLPTATIAISIHALLAESDNAANDDEQNTFVFLSTLSLRRATSRYTGGAAAIHNFYPRSPCGERRKHQRQGAGGERISIHALLAESDAGCASGNPARRPFLSTLSLRRATSSPAELRRWCEISIHALLAESDHYSQGIRFSTRQFLSTLSLRRATL